MRVRQAIAAIQGLADRNPHAALRTKVGYAQIVYFAKSGRLPNADVHAKTQILQRSPLKRT